jgi:hypothetical protein
MAGLLDYLEGIGETGATLGTGLLSGVVGAPYGLFKGITSGYYGSPQAVRIAQEEAKKFMERNTYVPRGKVAQEALQKAAQLMEQSKLPPIIPEAIALGSIPRQAYLAQAERRGMDLERAMAPRVEKMLERGGAGADVLQGLANRTISPMDVYHGSPHKLQPTIVNPLGEFDASKIGTGAGAQRYGYGIYTSESPQFADMFAVRKGLPDLEGIARQNGLELSQNARTELMRQATRDNSGKPARGMKGDNYIDPAAAAKKLQNASIEARQMPADKLQNTIREFQEQNRAYLYKADLPDEKIAKMLDFDKHLSEQSSEIQKILLPYQKEIGTSFGTGGQVLKEIAFDRRMKGLDDSPAAVAQQLRDMGIPGVTYKDLDTRNFVTFPGEEKSMKILERNGFSGLLAE